MSTTDKAPEGGIDPIAGQPGQTALGRRKFLGIGMAGAAGLAMAAHPVLARAGWAGKGGMQGGTMAGAGLPAEGGTGASTGALASAETASGTGIDKVEAGSVFSGKETAYWDRTDRFEEKMKLLQSAWEKKDFRVVRSLTDSLRTTCIQAQVEEEHPGTPVSGSSQYGEVEKLPAAWRAWAKGWRYYKPLSLRPTGTRRVEDPSAPWLGYPLTATPTEHFMSKEPVETLLGFPAGQVRSLSREIRVARLEKGVLKEIVSQVFSELRRGQELFCKLLFMADSVGADNQTYLIFYGNPDAELPAYPSDLITSGEGFALDIENDFFKVSLSRQHGQIERMEMKREHGMQLYAGGQGHGEPPGIDWAHDYVTEGSFQKLRISLWERCPDFEVVKGPLCTIVRRWGFPYSPVHPLFSPSRLNMDVEYRFYAGLPYFRKSAQMTAIKDFELAALRDDEWVFTGQSFTDTLWMGPDGKVKIGEVDAAHKDNLWGIGFFNKDTRDSFMGLFLEHRADGMPEPRHSGSPTMYYRWHGTIWSRYPIYGKSMPAGAVLHESNAYVALPFTTTDGPAMIEELRNRLKEPLAVEAGALLSEGGVVGVAGGAAEAMSGGSGGMLGRLARPGEAGDSLISKKLLWEALGNCKDPQLYTADISIVDLGLVYDICVRGDTVKVVLAMPHRGRPLGIYFANGSNSVHAKISLNISDALHRVPGVGEVTMEQTWYPGWSSNLLTEEGRRKLGL